MKKTRVNKGEKYWYIYDKFEVTFSIEDNSPISNKHFETNNYFHTKEEAESMARKIRAILKGAEVIEMPSEEEIEAYKKKLNHPHTSGCDYMERVVTDTANYSNLCGFQLGINWLKSKIIK